MRRMTLKGVNLTTRFESVRKRTPSIPGVTYSRYNANMTIDIHMHKANLNIYFERGVCACLLQNFFLTKMLNIFGNIFLV